MKKLFFIWILLFLSTKANSQYNVVTWSDILLERGIEELHNILSMSDDEIESEFMENHLLITEDGFIMDNKYFDVSTTKKLKEKNLDKNIFYNEKIFFKILKLLDRKSILFLRATVRQTDLRYYVFFETISASNYKNNFYFKHYNTLGLFVYKYDNDKKNFFLEETETFRH